MTANGIANTVSVLPGHGDGSFRAKTDYGTGNSPIAMAVGVLDGDGWPDVAVGTDGSQVPVLRNLRDGVLAPGPHVRSWHRTTTSGSAVRTGADLVRLSSLGVRLTRKVRLVR